MRTYKSDRAVRTGVGLIRCCEAISKEQERLLLMQPCYASTVSGHLNGDGLHALAQDPLVQKWQQIARACTAKLLMTRIEAVYAGNKERADYIEKHVIAPLVRRANAYSAQFRGPQAFVDVMDRVLSRPPALLI